MEIELPGDLKEIPTKLEKFSSTVSSLTTQSKIKTLDAIPILFNKLTEALDRFAQAVQDASQKAGDQGVPSAVQAGTHPAEGEKNTRQVTITHLFKQRTKKDVEKANLNKQPILTTTQTTTVIPPIIPTTLQLQSPFLSSSSKSSPQPEGELIKKDQGKKVISSKDVEEEGTKSDSDDANLTGSKRIEESVKADLAKQEVELGKDELVDLLGIDVVTGFYKAKLQYDKYCDKRLNRKGQSKITNYDVLTTKGPITLKACPNKKGAGWSTIYGKIKTRKDYLHKTEAELEINFSIPFSEQDSLDKLNDHARKKRKHDDDIHDYFRSTKKYNHPFI
ncbi:hypothetical protein Tco_0774422 [Tanacetum coccineum]|uniref:Uncharacterized protein n=1 Tax=Tanacetum coccineum TaxID=301880 RepID=A0ABQ4ZR08_9ASTR